MHNTKCYYASFDEGLPDQLISTLGKWFTMFQRVVRTSLLGGMHSMKYVLPDPEDKDSMIL